MFLPLLLLVALSPYKKLPGQALILQLCFHVPKKVVSRKQNETLIVERIKENRKR